MRAWESQALEGTVSEPSALQSQQKLLTIEKKSESRAQKLEAEALEALEARDGRYQEKLLASYLRPGIPSPDQKERGEKRMDVEGAVSAPSFVGGEGNAHKYKHACMHACMYELTIQASFSGRCMHTS